MACLYCQCRDGQNGNPGEEVYLFEYENFTEAQQRIEGFIERVYNEKRLHSALDYRPPNEYEQWLLDQQTPEGVAG